MNLKLINRFTYNSIFGVTFIKDIWTYCYLLVFDIFTVIDNFNYGNIDGAFCSYICFYKKQKEK
jgi:hypothetical protein